MIERLVAQFNEMQDPYIKERAVDVKDIGLRVLHHLVNTEHAIKDYPENTILIAHTLTPAMLAEEPWLGSLGRKGLRVDRFWPG